MSKENFHFYNHLVNTFSFLSQNFLKEIETMFSMFSMFLSSYRNTRGSLGEKAVETLACWLMFPQHFSNIIVEL